MSRPMPRTRPDLRAAAALGWTTLAALLAVHDGAEICITFLVGGEPVDGAACGAAALDRAGSIHVLGTCAKQAHPRGPC